MKSNRFRILAVVLGFIVAQAPGVANAKVSWTFNQANCWTPTDRKCQTGKFSGSKTYKESAGWGVDDVTVSGWANTADSNSGANTILERGKIAHWTDGLGVKNADKRNGDDGERSLPQNAIDSVQRIDMVLFDFGRLVNLHEVTLGWPTTPGLYDTDISVLAYTGSLVPGNTAADYVRNQKASYIEETLTDSGWTVVGNYEVNQTQVINPTSIVSNYWIVSAYNRVFGETCVTATGTKTCDYTPDYFKISALGNNDSPDVSNSDTIPEPATALLLATALAFTRRMRFKRG